METADIAGYLSELALFQGTPYSHVRGIANVMYARTLAAGETYCREGDASDSMAVLLSGELTASVTRPGGETIRLGQIYPGEFAGELACLVRGPRAATVSAARDSRVVILPFDQFRWLEESAPRQASALWTAVIRNMAKRLRDTNARIQAFLEGQPGAPPGLMGEPDPSEATDAAHFKDAELDLLEKAFPPAWRAPNHVLCQEGEPGHVCWVIGSGTLEVLRRIDRDEHRIAVLTQGTVAGHMSLLDGARRSATLRVLEPGYLMEVTKQQIETLLNADAPLALRFHQTMAAASASQLRSAIRSLVAAKA